MSQDQATPRPWKLEGDKMSVSNINNEGVCDCYFGVPANTYVEGKYEANARLIVKAVNCHDELVEALEIALGYAEIQNSEYDGQDKSISKDIELIKQALAKAESEDV